MSTDSAFKILGVSIRDSRSRIVEAAEDKALELDFEKYSKARDALINPRLRLHEELRWLPGLSPKRALEATQKDYDYLGQRESIGVSPFASFNLLAFETSKRTENTRERTADILSAMSDVFEEIDPERIASEVNEDRAIAQFPAVTIKDVEDALSPLWRERAADALSLVGQLDTDTIIQLMRAFAEEVSVDGIIVPNEFVCILYEQYEIEAQRFLEPEAQNIQRLCNAILDSGHSETALAPFANELEALVRRWDEVAQPFQLIALAKGLDHEPSRELANALRGFSVSLHNDKNQSHLAKEVSDLCAEVFAELPNIGETFEEDRATLDDVIAARARSVEEEETFASEMLYEAEVGTFLKQRISVSAQQINWKNDSIKLDEIIGARWGATKEQYTTSFSIVLTSPKKVLFISFSGHAEVFQAVISRIWRSVGVRLLLEMLTQLSSGKRFRIGNVTFDDTTVTLPETKVFGAKLLNYNWEDVESRTYNGALQLLSYDAKASASLSYTDVNNAHVLRRILEMRLEREVAALSDLLS